MKCGPDFTFEVPPRLVPYLARYIDHHRPRMLQGNVTDALWVTREGQAMSCNGLRQRFLRAMPRIFGEPMTMHAFRHSAASTIAELEPKGAEFAPLLLGHQDPGTSARFYVKRQRSRAVAEYQTILSRSAILTSGSGDPDQ